MGWETIQHSHLPIRGLNLHVAHTGPAAATAVVFLHGFPEIWYTWRHQMVAVAAAGFRAIAPDFRGYGLSDQPSEPEKATWKDLTDDLLAILDYLSIPKAFIVAKDFGALPAYSFALHYPDRVSGVVTLGIPFVPDENSVMYAELPEGYYLSRWRVPGRAEADFGRLDVKTVVRNIYILFSGSEFPNAKEDQEIMDLVDPSTPLPPWFSEEDLDVYASLYDKSGFRFALQIPYRSLKELTGIANPKVEVPALLIMGGKDYVLQLPGFEDYIRSGMVKHFVPNLDIEFIEEGNHFVHEQLPDEVNELILKFIKT
ncbi:putative alpha/beta hydrolase-1, epoxide hydrolase [Dioscorea sansibarensis]